MESSSSSESGPLLNVKNDQESLVPKTKAQFGLYGRKLNARSEALVLQKDKNLVALAEIIQMRKLQSLKKIQSNSNKKPMHIPNTNTPSLQLVADALSKAAEDNLNERKRLQSTAGILTRVAIGVQKTGNLLFRKFVRVPSFSPYPARFRTPLHTCELGKDTAVEALVPVHKYLDDPKHNQLQQITATVVEQATTQATTTSDPHHEKADQFVAEYLVETEKED